MLGRHSTSLPLMSVVGMLDDLSESKLGWLDRCRGWDLQDHAVLQHKLSLEKVDLESISSADPQWRIEGASTPIGRNISL